MSHIAISKYFEIFRNISYKISEIETFIQIWVNVNINNKTGLPKQYAHQCNT